MKRLAIVGSTGSIGVQTLDVVKQHQDKFSVEVLTAQNNADLLIEQSMAFKPNSVVIANESLYDKVKSALDSLDIKVFAGSAALEQIVEMDSIDMVVSACVGFAGLAPTMRAIEKGKPIALANKEVLVVAGELVNKLAMEKKIPILPVDSEHSAIMQCLAGEWHNPVDKIWLTASGGPFRGKTKAELASITKAQALKHPNWEMGHKITIDSATLMNKGLEVIEAKWLFDLKPEQIDVIVHPQSIIHSLVQFADSSIKAQMGLPDMRLPIQYAIGYPDRLPADFKRFDFTDYPELTFHKADIDTFRCLALAYQVLHEGGNKPCILNAANEVAVDAFLNDKISFLQIPELIEKSLNLVSFVAHPTLDDYKQTDTETRIKIQEIINNK